MAITKTERSPASAPSRRSAASTPACGPVGVVLGALLMAWPAFYNGFPLIYPDSLWYMNAGKSVAAAVLLNHRSHSYGNRSLIYSLGILPFHLDRTFWPIVMVQCLLTSWVLWLVIRSLSARSKWSIFFILMIVLSLFSTMSWFGALAMPDILGPDLYLCTFLLVFAADTIARAERIALRVIAWWAIASHPTHLLIAIVLCCAMTIVAIFQRMPLRRYLEMSAQLATIIALAVGAQIALDAFLYGKPSLEGERPPFLTARLVVDGPGRWYLERHCAESSWEMCHHLDNLSGSSERFLWGANGVWQTATASSQRLMRSQDGPFAIAVWRAYPREELLQSAANFMLQLRTFDLRSCVRTPEVNEQFRLAVPQLEGKYLQSRQARKDLPLNLFNAIDHVLVVVSLAAIAVFLPWFWRRRPVRLIALGFVIAVSVVANALVTGTLSTVDGRFGARVIWLVPFFAALCVLQMAWDDPLQSRPPARAPSIAETDSSPSLAEHDRCRSGVRSTGAFLAPAGETS